MKKKVLIMMLAAGAVLALADAKRTTNRRGRTIPSLPRASIFRNRMNGCRHREERSDYSSYWENHPVSFENCAWIINTDDGASLKYMNSGQTTCCL